MSRSSRKDVVASASYQESPQSRELVALKTVSARLIDLQYNVINQPQNLTTLREILNQLSTIFAKAENTSNQHLEKTLTAAAIFFSTLASHVGSDQYQALTTDPNRQPVKIEPAKLAPAPELADKLQQLTGECQRLTDMVQSAPQLTFQEILAAFCSSLRTLSYPFDQIHDAPADRALKTVENNLLSIVNGLAYNWMVTLPKIR